VTRYVISRRNVGRSLDGFEPEDAFAEPTAGCGSERGLQGEGDERDRGSVCDKYA
jgi:hypothetical protein